MARSTLAVAALLLLSGLTAAGCGHSGRGGAPTQVSLEVEGASATGGDRIEVRVTPAPGRDALEAATIEIDGDPVDSSAEGDDVIAFTMPANEAGNVSGEAEVTLVMAGTTWPVGTIAWSAAAPAVTGATPAGGTHRGGTKLSLAGTGFVPGCTVAIGGAAATDVVIVSATDLTCLTPVGSVGPARITVNHPEGVMGGLDGAFTFTNAAPRVVGLQRSLGEDGSTGLALEAEDDDGDPLTFDVSAPGHGVLAGVAPILTYTPAQDWNGVDAFEFTATDGLVVSTPATVELTVVSENDAPLALAQSLATDEDVALAVTLEGADVDGDELSYSVGFPAHGTLSGVPPKVVYTPDPHWSGDDSFTFAVSDASVSSAKATVTITVSAVNDAPVASAQATSTPEDVATTITLSGSDVEKSALTFAIVDPPAHGALAQDGASVTFTPDADWNGSDAFTFTVDDGALTSAPASVSITVGAANDAPTAQAGSASTDEDVATAISLAASDVDGDALTYEVSAQPARGSVAIVGSTATYTPAEHWSGADSFTFTARDGALTSPAATVTITVSAVNDAPVASAQATSTLEDVVTTVMLSGSDVEGSVLTFAIVDPPAHGALAQDGASVTYTPAADWNGSDAFTFTVDDGARTSAPATVSITVDAVNDGPTAQAGSASTDEDVATAIALAASDVDGDALTYEVAAQPAHGSVAIVGSEATYTPAEHWSGEDSFTFTARDGALTSLAATVTIIVSAVNDAPVASAQATSTLEDVATTVTLSGSDVEKSALTFAIVDPPAHGALAQDGASVTYTPAADWNGSDAFTFTVDDGALTSAPATVSITVDAVNDGPTAQAGSASTDEDVATAIALAATDVDGDALTYEVSAQPARGSVAIVGSTATYTPEANWSGQDSFTFTARDAALTSSAATVTISVSPVNDRPTATAQSVSSAPDEAKEITLAGADVEGGTLTFAIAQQPTKGAVVLAGSTATYTPSTGYSGPDSFTFTASDGSLTSSPATVSISVAPPVPTVTSVSPANGPHQGGTAITVSGEKFASGAKVLLDGVACSSVVVVDQFTITCRTPSGVPGWAMVVVENTGGLQGSKFDAFLFTGIDVAESPPTSTGLTQDYPSVALAGGVMHLAWSEGSSPRDVLYRQSGDRGVTWTDPITICQGPSTSDDIYPTVLSNGDAVLVVWQDTRDGGTNRDVYARRSADGGVTWLPDFRINTDVGLTSQYIPSAAMDGDLVVVSWHSAETTPRQVWTRRSTDGGATWQPVVQVPSAGNGCGVTNVAVSGTTVLVAWEQQTGTAGIGFARSTDGGATSGGASLISPAGSRYYPALAISGSAAVVAWIDGTPSGVRGRSSSDGGATWGVEQALSPADGKQAPTLAAEGQEVLLVYSDWNVGGAYLRRSTDGGATFSLAERMDGADSRECVVDIDRGEFAVLYKDGGLLYVRMGAFAELAP